MSCRLNLVEPKRIMIARSIEINGVDRAIIKNRTCPR